MKSGGVVDIGVVIGTDGRPRDLNIVKSIDAASDAEAIRAVSNWRFEPATCDGLPVNVKITVEIDTHLYPN